METCTGAKVIHQLCDVTINLQLSSSVHTSVHTHAYLRAYLPMLTACTHLSIPVVCFLMGGVINY